MKLSKLLFGLLLMGPITPLAAMSLGDIGSDIYNNAKISFLDKAQVGWGWNLKHESNGGPMALLSIWEYRFLLLSAGWADATNQELEGAPAILGGVHVDKLVRLIAPNSSEAVRSVIPEVLRKGYDKLTVSYGPAYDLDRGEWTHFVGINMQFGGE